MQGRRALPPRKRTVKDVFLSRIEQQPKRAKSFAENNSDPRRAIVVPKKPRKYTHSVVAAVVTCVSAMLAFTTVFSYSGPNSAIQLPRH